jgi:TRAP-type mannitol/chloroaromatic compound transport system permease large subunit
MTYKEMYLGVLPFVGLQLVVLTIIAIYPPTATYLPVLFLGN